MAYIVDLRDLTGRDLPLAGGKGANLGELIRAGLPVPGGFCITTNAYDTFVEANGLSAHLSRILAATTMDDPESLEKAGDEIHAGFARGRVPGPLGEEIRAAYAGIRPSSSAGALVGDRRGSA